MNGATMAVDAGVLAARRKAFLAAQERFGDVRVGKPEITNNEQGQLVMEVELGVYGGFQITSIPLGTAPGADYFEYLEYLEEYTVIDALEQLLKSSLATVPQPLPTAHFQPYFAPPTAASDVPCSDCHKLVGPFYGGTAVIEASRVVEMTQARYGRVLCVECSGIEGRRRVVASGGRKP